MISKPNLYYFEFLLYNLPLKLLVSASLSITTIKAPKVNIFIFKLQVVGFKLAQVVRIIFERIVPKALEFPLFAREAQRNLVKRTRF